MFDSSNNNNNSNDGMIVVVVKTDVEQDLGVVCRVDPSLASFDEILEQIVRQTGGGSRRTRGTMNNFSAYSLIRLNDDKRQGYVLSGLSMQENDTYLLEDALPGGGGGNKEFALNKIRSYERLERYDKKGGKGRRGSQAQGGGGGAITRIAPIAPPRSDTCHQVPEAARKGYRRKLFPFVGRGRGRNGGNGNRRYFSPAPPAGCCTDMVVRPSSPSRWARSSGPAGCCAADAVVPSVSNNNMIDDITLSSFFDDSSSGGDDYDDVDDFFDNGTATYHLTAAVRTLLNGAYCPQVKTLEGVTYVTLPAVCGGMRNLKSSIRNMICLPSGAATAATPATTRRSPTKTKTTKNGRQSRSRSRPKQRSRSKQRRSASREQINRASMEERDCAEEEEEEVSKEDSRVVKETIEVIAGGCD